MSWQHLGFNLCNRHVRRNHKGHRDVGVWLGILHSNYQPVEQKTVLILSYILLRVLSYYFYMNIDKQPHECPPYLLMLTLNARFSQLLVLIWKALEYICIFPNMKEFLYRTLFVFCCCCWSYFKINNYFFTLKIKK